ncbi:hypothetical protein EQV77_14520 [Halobacillus fulvus]|nr:hypothetical protein EQV77_14520 [Halobacillus fulvus]
MNGFVVCGDEKMLQRKIIAASITGALFAVLLGLIIPNPFGEQVVAERNYFHSATIIMGLYLMYSFPVILIYGVLTSIISDKAAEFLSKKSKSKNIEIVISGILHIVFGLVLLHFSLGASILFFITDRIFKKQNRSFNWPQAIASFVIPLTVLIISISMS